MTEAAPSTGAHAFTIAIAAAISRAHSLYDVLLAALPLLNKEAAVVALTVELPAAAGTERTTVVMADGQAARADAADHGGRSPDDTYAAGFTLPGGEDGAIVFGLLPGPPAGQALLDIAAAQIASRVVASHSAARLADAEDRARQLAVEVDKLATLSRDLISTLNLDELLVRVAEDILQVVGFERCCLFMRDRRRAAFLPRVWRGYPDTIARNPVREGEGAIGLAARTKVLLKFDSGDPLWREEGHDRQHAQLRGFARSLGTPAFAAAPILTSRKDCIGVLVADNKGSRQPISSVQTSLLSAFANQAGIAIENARLYEEMQENYKHIHRLKAYTDSVLQSIGAGILSTDARGRVARWNRAAEETFRQPARSFRSATLTAVIDRLCLPESERLEVLGMIRRVEETGERINQHKYALHPAGREPMALNLMISRLAEQNLERAGIVLIFEDVTQEVRLEGEVEKMRRLADIGQLAARMAHEVRNALSPIKGAAQILRLEAESVGAAAEWCDIITAEVDGLSRLTSEMLEFARPSLLNLETISLREFLIAAVASLSAFLVEHRTNVRWLFEPYLPAIMADPVQIGQIARNLVMNAAQAMPEGGELTISATSDAAARTVEIVFSDTGIGIPAADLDRVFRPFVTTKTKGTGLGLPIVQKIVDHHGGAIRVQSEPGGGTRFLITLPLNPPRDIFELTDERPPLISSHRTGDYPDQ